MKLNFIFNSIVAAYLQSGQSGVLKLTFSGAEVSLRDVEWRGLYSLRNLGPTQRLSISVQNPPLSSCSLPIAGRGLNSLSDHCPIRLFQGSETVFRRRLCRSMSLSYGFNHLCHGRGRGFESRRPRHSFQSLIGIPFWALPSKTVR